MVEQVFLPILIILCIACSILVYILQKRQTIPETSNEFKQFQWTYLLAYFLATGNKYLK